MSRSQVLWSAIGSTAPDEPPKRDFISDGINLRVEMMLYLADSRHHECRTECFPQRMLECVSVLAVPATKRRIPTISLNSNGRERRRSFKIVRDEAC